MNSVARIITRKHSRSVVGAFTYQSHRFAEQLGPSRCNNNKIHLRDTESLRFNSTAVNKKALDSSANTLHGTVPEKSNGMKSSHPVLNHVKKLPIVGSLLPQLSGVPDSIFDAYKFWPKMRESYGDFYSMGLPSFGAKDWCGTAYIITDPQEMVKVVRAGGAYPSGGVENLLVSIKWNETRGMHTGALLRNGMEWKRIRNFMQKDFLHPEAARNYVPGMIQAAKLASKGAPAMNKELNNYLGLCAFDLFSTIMFGELTKTADPAADKDLVNVEFVMNAMDGISTSVQLLFYPYEVMMIKMFGLETPMLKRAFKGFDKSWEIACSKIEAFKERKKLGQLNENEEVSYLSRALDRQKEDGNDITVREAQELSFAGLVAAVDTTSSVIGWNLFNIARHPQVQEKLYEELSHAIATVGNGELTTDVLDRKNTPYLHAVIRENQRLTPIGTIYVSKRLAESVEINGIRLNEGDVVCLEGFSLGMDPQLVDNPNSFEPERWLSDAVTARKGTPKEIIDHPFLKEPFSQGARRCPGSRVAANEVQVMLSQLVLDWKMTSPISSLDDAKYSQQTFLVLELPELDFQSRV